MEDVIHRIRVGWMKFVSAVEIPCDLRILIRLTIKFCNVIGLAMLYNIDVVLSRCHFHNYN